MVTSRFGFSRNERLHLNRDFKKIFKEGRAWHNGALTLVVFNKPSESNCCPAGERGKPRPQIGARVGIIVPGKTAGAVLRNRLKRRMREIFRLNKENIIKSADIIFIVRKEAAVIGYRELENKIFDLWRKAKIFK